jgi:hypothetical protein
MALDRPAAHGDALHDSGHVPERLGVVKFVNPERGIADDATGHDCQAPATCDASAYTRPLLDFTNKVADALLTVRMLQHSIKKTLEG